MHGWTPSSCTYHLKYIVTRFIVLTQSGSWPGCAHNVEMPLLTFVPSPSDQSIWRYSFRVLEQCKYGMAMHVHVKLSQKELASDKIPGEFMKYVHVHVRISLTRLTITC